MPPAPFRFPEPLRPGDLVAVVAPASPFPRDEFFRGLAWLRGRYRLRVRADVLARTGYLAGADARRRGELAAAILDREVRAIVAARGGSGATRVLADLPWAELARAPKWIAGFSDVTALHACAWRHGVASVHGPNVTGMGRDLTPRDRLAWLDALEGRRRARRWDDLRVVARGAAARGPIVGGNLALLEALAAAGELVVPEGAVLAIEDVTERPYRLDRMLTALRAGGHLARAAAIVVGGLDRCDPGPDGVTADAVIDERLGDLGCPVVAGAPFGHGRVNEPFVLGGDARVEGDAVIFE